MSDYYNKLSKLVNSGGFVRVFYGRCPKCEKNIFSIGEEYDDTTQKIKAMFICPCGYKYKETMVQFDQKLNGGYKYPQGLVEDIKVKGKVKHVIKCQNKYFMVTPEKIMSKEVTKHVKSEKSQKSTD